MHRRVTPKTRPPRRIAPALVKRWGGQMPRPGASPCGLAPQTWRLLIDIAASCLEFTPRALGLCPVAAQVWEGAGWSLIGHNAQIRLLNLCFGSADGHDGHVILASLGHHCSSDPPTHGLGTLGVVGIEYTTKSFHTFVETLSPAFDQTIGV